MNTKRYRNAVNNIGDLQWEWKDKPHRLVYDLCGHIERLESLVNNLIRQTESYSDDPNAMLDLIYEDFVPKAQELMAKPHG